MAKGKSALTKPNKGKTIAPAKNANYNNPGRKTQLANAKKGGKGTAGKRVKGSKY